MAKKKLNSVIGVDIGSQSIKIAEVRNLGRECTVSALGIVDTPAGMVDHTGVYDTDTIGGLIKQLCANAGCSVQNVVASIAGQASILVRTLEVPKMNPNELKDHMAWEISRNIPFAESNVFSDYKAFPSNDPNASNMDVVMAIAPESAVQTLLNIFKKAGKKAHALDVEPLGIARALEANYGVELGNETVCVIDIGHKTTSINMYGKGGQLLLPRQVPMGGETFTSAIANSMAISAEDAEKLKVEQGNIPDSVGAAGPAASFGAAAVQDFAPYNPFTEDYAVPDAPQASVTDLPSYGDENPYAVPAPADAEPGEPTYGSPFDAEPAGQMPAPADQPPADDGSMRIYNAMAGELDEFVAEVRRSIDYFRSKGGEVHRIMICGGGAKLKGLSGLINRAIGIKTEVFDPFHTVSVTARKMEEGLLESHRAEFAIALGNGLHIAFD